MRIALCVCLMGPVQRRRDGGVKIKTEQEKAWRMRKGEKRLREKKDEGDKMRQIERGTMRLGSKRE